MIYFKLQFNIFNLLIKHKHIIKNKHLIQKKSYLSTYNLNYIHKTPIYKSFYSNLSWTRNPKDPRFIKFKKQEKDNFENETFQNKKSFYTFYNEIRSRIHNDEESVSERIGNYYYYMKQHKNKNYPIYYRKLINNNTFKTTFNNKNSLNENETIVLDQNELINKFNYTFLSLNNINISPNERYIAYTIDINGNENYYLQVRDIFNGTIYTLPHLKDIPVISMEWIQLKENGFLYNKDKMAILYTIPDSYRRPYRVYSHILNPLLYENNNSMIKDSLLYEEKNNSFFLDLSITKDKKYILINSNSKTTSEVYYIKNNNYDHINDTFKIIKLREREEGIQYFVEHGDESFYIVTNLNNASNYKVIRVMDNDLNNKWIEWIKEDKNIKIEDMDILNNYLILYERVHSMQRIRIFSCKDLNDIHIVQIPKNYLLGHLIPGINSDFNINTILFSISTPLVPECTFQYDIKNRKLKIMKENKVRTNTKKKILNNEKNEFINDDYIIDRIYVESTKNNININDTNNKVKIPLTLVYHKNIKKNGTNPTILYGYGAYGSNMEINFQLERISLLTRGWILAFAHVRGGGELGLKWYENGKKLNKLNTFYDFIDCCEYLIRKKFTNSNYLIGSGTSAGGLIMGYIANNKPELVKGLIMKVPFVDIYNTMLDTTLPLTIHEYDEWGNVSNDKLVQEYIKNYSPCENVLLNENTIQIPHMFITGAMNDQRVMFWEPIKWVYLIRQAIKYNKNKNKPTIWFHLSKEDGHFGGIGRLEQCRNAALEYSFLYKILNLKV